MLKTEKLTKYYKDVRGIENIDLEIKDGEVFGLLGPNGAGKSTFIKTIMNLINKTSGQFYINNKEITSKNDYKKVVGYLPSEVYLYGDLTAKEMINYAASFYDEDLSKRINYLTKKLEVPMEKKISDLSYGNLKKVDIVLTLMHKPKFLILDEPTSGLDPLITDVFFKLLNEEKENGATILFSTHILSEVKRICDRVGFIKNGHLMKIIDIDNLLNNSYHSVTIISPEFKKLKLPIKDMIIKKQTDNSINFIYKGNINDLVKIISQINLENLIIEEPKIEDVFMGYYK